MIAWLFVAVGAFVVVRSVVDLVREWRKPPLTERIVQAYNERVRKLLEHRRSKP